MLGVANGFTSVDSALVHFSTLGSTTVDVEERTGPNAGESDGIGLAADGSVAENALQIDFDVLVNQLSLTFGNDDPKVLPNGTTLQAGVDQAVLTVFLSGSEVGSTAVLVNANNVMDQSISISGVVFDRAVFEYADAAGDNFLYLSEVIDNVQFVEVPEPIATGIAGYCLLVGALSVRRRYRRGRGL